MIAGMDFGTTNSGMAVYDGRELRPLPLDRANENPRVLRTALYVTNDQEVVVGREALNEFFNQNVGRPVKLERVWVGEIEVRGADMFFIRDVYVWVDVMSPGRLFLSFKTNLRDHDYSGTVVGQNFYPIESLVALYLTVAKKRAEQLLQREIKEVVLGRPVHFATDPAHDQLAQERLLRGAFLAGYERVYLQPEPVAAAYDYANRTGGKQNILIFDFGGGTLDITVMRIEGHKRQVLATGGVPIAGDVFDQKLVRAKLPRHFGEGQRYGPREMPSPRWIYDLFSNWQTILELQTPQNMRVLHELEQTARRPSEIRGLINLVSGNYGLQMFDATEQAKRDLSTRFGSMIRLQGPEFRVLELVTRREFENIIRAEVHRIEQELLDTVAASGLVADDIDAVIRTGGSSEIPIFQEMLRRHFGRDKLQALDTFSSVTAGLAIMGHAIERGELESHAYTPDELSTTISQAQKKNSPNVQPVNLERLQRRIAAQEAGDTMQGDGQLALVMLTADNQLQFEMVQTAALHAAETIPLQNAPIDKPLLAHLFAGLDETLLLITSRYRFLLLTARQLVEEQALGLKLADRYRFQKDEEIFTVSSWSRLKACEKTTLVTSTGLVRAYPTQILAQSIEAPVPWSFDNPLPGWPLAALPSDNGEEVVMVTDAGRGARLPVAQVPLRGFQALNRSNGETITAITLIEPDAELVLVTADGYARRMQAAWVPEPVKQNMKGKVLVSRRPVVGVAPVGEGPLWLLAGNELIPLDPAVIPGDQDTTKTHRLRHLPKGAILRALLPTVH